MAWEHWPSSNICMLHERCLLGVQNNTVRVVPIFYDDITVVYLFMARTPILVLNKCFLPHKALAGEKRPNQGASKAGTS